MTEPELIDKNELMRRLLSKPVSRETPFCQGMVYERDATLELINELPKADTPEGGAYWVDAAENVSPAGKFKICTNCNKAAFVLKTSENIGYNYCPNCGTKMKLKD